MNDEILKRIEALLGAYDELKDAEFSTVESKEIKQSLLDSEVDALKNLLAKSKSEVKAQGVPQLNTASMNDWFLSLAEGHRNVLRDDKWALANAAFTGGYQLATKTT
jgi:hypothetical protein